MSLFQAVLYVCRLPEEKIPPGCSKEVRQASRGSLMLCSLVPLWIFESGDLNGSYSTLTCTSYLIIASHPVQYTPLKHININVVFYLDNVP